MISAERRPTEPLASWVRFFGLFLATITAVSIVLAIAGLAHPSFGGFGDTSVCVDQPRTGYDAASPPAFIVSARPGATITTNGTLRACALHPSVGERILYTLTGVSFLFWLGLFFLLWRTIRAAEKYGPFTPRVAGLLRVTGWFIVAGGIAAASVQGAATDALLTIMIRPGSDFADAIPLPSGALLVEVLAGAAVLTFARIIGRGADLEADLAGTV